MKSILAISLALALTLLTSVSAVTTVVTPGNPNGWGYLQETAVGSGSFVDGPGTPPLGIGSAELTVDSTGGVILGAALYSGTRLADITALEYSTYRVTGASALAIALQLNFDANLNDGNEAWQGRLVYEPYHTYTVNDAEWQTWNTLDNAPNGNWWFSGAPGNAVCPQANPCTWSEVVSAFPDGGIHNTFGAVIFKAGGGWTGGFTGNVDAFSISIGENEDTYDFEFTEPPADTDGDGVLNENDICDGTVADAPTSALGTNRHIWNGNEFVTLVPGKGKNNFNTVPSEFSIVDTYGCGCKQILDQMTEKTGFDFEGHYKHGCSKSVIEAWIAGEYYVGPTLVETVEVPSTSSTDTLSTSVLDLGKDYFLRASGTAFACNTPGCVIEFDAEYSTSDATTWVDGVAAPYDGLGPDLLDLKVDGNFVDWGAYSATHEYEIPYPGTGAMLGLLVYDTHYPSNSGSLFVDIIEDKWVSLW